jgi:hypothetical protein
MTREEFDDIRPKLIDSLKCKPPLNASDLLSTLVGAADLSESEARNAIWRMIDDGDIRLSLDRKFEVAVTQG